MPIDWSRVISVSVVPLVTVSAGALLCLALYSRLASIVARLRLLQRERMDQQRCIAELHQSKSQETSMIVRCECILENLQEQAEKVLRRARLIRSALIFLLAAILSLVICSAFSGLAVWWTPAIHGAVYTFFLGLMFIMLGALCALLEMRAALDPVELESEFVDDLVATDGEGPDRG